MNKNSKAAIGISAVMAVIILLNLVGTGDNDDLAVAPATAVRSAPPAPTQAVSTTPSSPFPGIDRFGRDKAAQNWANMNNLPGVHSWRCDESRCYVDFDPAMWNQAPYDLRRNVVAMLGIAMAYGKRARRTVVLNQYDHAEFGRYDAATDDVRLK